MVLYRSKTHNVNADGHFARITGYAWTNVWDWYVASPKTYIIKIYIKLKIPESKLSVLEMTKIVDIQNFFYRVLQESGHENSSGTTYVFTIVLRGSPACTHHVICNYLCAYWDGFISSMWLAHSYKCIKSILNVFINLQYGPYTLAQKNHAEKPRVAQRKDASEVRLLLSQMLW